MIYNDFKGMKLSALGFGTMRLPMIDGRIDEPQTEKMIAMAMEAGVNYYDTAWPYHDGTSEIVSCRMLRRYPRESYYLADKFPGHQVAESYEPSYYFEKQLEKCGVEYFDFYLLHNVYEQSIETYLSPKWGIIDYLLEQKRKGRIRHLGFSTHGGIETLERFLKLYGHEMEFCQIQLNYMDWTLQHAKEKCELLAQYHIPVWVMEPVRGGRLAKLDEETTAKLRALRPNESTAAWAFRFLQGLPNVKVVLSGMSNIAQMEDNLKTYAEPNPLCASEQQLLMDIAAGMSNMVPCTGCRYCIHECPQGLNIPLLLQVYNDMRFTATVNVSMRMEALPEDKKSSACLACGACTRMCPQHIDIPAAMQELTALCEKMPTWADVSRQRAEAAARLEAENAVKGSAQHA